MPRTVRARLIASTLLTSLSAIVVVGLATLLLLDTYFTRAERSYLRRQAEIYLEPLAEVAATSDPLTLQYATALVGLASQVRVQVLDDTGAIVADSGPRQPIAVADPEQALPLAVIVDEGGRTILLSPPVQSDGSSTLPETLWRGGALELALESSFTAVSDTTLQIPIDVNGVTIGAIQLSNGPAVGTGVEEGIRLALLISGGAALLAAAAIGWLAAQPLTRALSALGRSADAMAEDLSARAPDTRVTEYNALANRLNAMAERLDATFQQVRKERAILQRTVADASHELRTPLTALKTFNELLAAEVPADSDAAAFITEGATQIAQLDAITRDLLDLSRLEARLSGTQFVAADARETVSSAVRLLQPFAVKRGQTVTVAVPSEPVRLTHDPTALSRAVGNIVHNAIKYSPPGGNVVVTVRDTAAAVTIAVKDEGPGIAAGALPRLFDRFYRGPEAGTSGSGLGLAIAREIVEIHGGTIDVTTAPGSGTTFALRLPHGLN